MEFPDGFLESKTANEKVQLEASTNSMFAHKRSFG
jgi:hypothetical protein